MTYRFVPDETSLGFLPVTENVSITQTIRTLQGRKKPCLLLASNGRHYVQKFLNRNGTDHLFNEALASQLGLALGLSLSAWAELQVDARDCRLTDAGVRRSAAIYFRLRTDPGRHSRVFTRQLVSKCRQSRGGLSAAFKHIRVMMDDLPLPNQVNRFVAALSACTVVAQALAHLAVGLLRLTPDSNSIVMGSHRHFT